MCIIILLLLVKRKREFLSSKHHRKIDVVSELEEEMANLENTSEGLMEDLNEIKTLEKEIKEKIKKIDN